MTQRAYKAIFFDLDGTLLPIDMDDFIKAYFAALRTFAQARGFDPDTFLAALLAGTHAMTEEGAGTNADRFWGVFEERAGVPADTLHELLDEYYRTSFDDLGALCAPAPDAARAVAVLKAKGYPLYLTTMPLFPLIAVEKRLAWAGIPADAFERITVYDNSTSTKPHLAYYRENVAAAGVDAHDILMVGNNTREDLAALELGLDGYLVTDWLLDPDGYDLSTVRHGSLADFARFAESLPECE